MIITVGNVKGGVAKTTTSVFLAHALSGTGEVALVDADPRHSATDWAETAGGFDFPVFPWSDATLVKHVQQVRQNYAHIVIDTPPELEALIRGGMGVCDLFICPVSPSPMEVRRLGATFQMVGEVAASHNFTATVLLCKVRPGTTSGRVAREVLEERQLPVLEAEVPLGERFVWAYGSKVEDLFEYGDVVAELVRAS